MKWYEKQKNIYAAKNEHDQQSEVNEKKEEAVNENQVNEPMETMEVEPSSKALKPILESSSELTKMYQESYLPSEFEKTVIGRGSSISGDIECAGDLQFHGSIHGNIICHGFLEIAGAEVTGNITCDHMKLEDAAINGNIACSGEMRIMENAVINGDVQTCDMENCGQVIGTVTAEHYVHIQSTGSIRGDVITEDIEITRGAVVQGLITMNQ